MGFDEVYEAHKRRPEQMPAYDALIENLYQLFDPKLNRR